MEDEVIFLGDLHEFSSVAERTMRLEYNAVVHCRRGRIELELGEGMKTESAAPAAVSAVPAARSASVVQGRKVVVNAGQVLVLPANKLLSPMLVSNDLQASGLLVSDKVLREVLGPHISQWNRAMFLEQVYVIDGGLWINGADSYARTLLEEAGGPEQFRLFRDLVLSFLRTMFLMICEMLTRHDDSLGGIPPQDASTSGERSIFDRFLSLLAQESVKRRQVSYYASRLNITAKYLSTVSKRVSGKSPTRWITESVMDDSYQMLRNSDLSVKEISNKLGFPNSSFFGQYFKEESGMTPLDYRNKAKSGR